MMDKVQNPSDSEHNKGASIISLFTHRFYEETLDGSDIGTNKGCTEHLCRNDQRECVLIRQRQIR
jgi:hypothetical protein